MPNSDSSPQFSVSEFLAVCNQTLEYSFSSVVVEGEVASFKVNQGKWVFFDLKDNESSVSCFMTLYQLRLPLEDGMKVRVRAVPKITKWGKFSLTIQQIMPVGEGSIKKSLELLKAKLQKEGLFDPAKKRPLPIPLSSIGVISSTQAAGYADFIKIINERWGGLDIKVAHTGVQGLGAADQIIRALNYFNEQAKVQIIVIIRGGGSADDLAVFNDELLVRAIAASRIPVVTGIGHEIDESLADLAADIVASTPSNAAQIITPDRRAELANIKQQVTGIKKLIYTQINQVKTQLPTQNLRHLVEVQIHNEQAKLQNTIKIIQSLNPENILRQGYAILSGQISIGNVVKITTEKQEINAEIKQIKQRSIK